MTELMERKSQNLWARFSTWIRAAFGIDEQDWRASITDVLAEASEGSSDLSREEHHMLRNLLGFRDVRIADLMVPRAEVTAVDETMSLGDLLAQFTQCAHSRLPVYRETLDHPVGMIHIKDVLARIDQPDFQISTLLREVLFAPPSMPALDLLLRMQASRTHMALVIDEYGGTDGLVTIEDLVEVIVGEIEDEHDDDLDDPELKPLGDGHWEAPARLDLSDLLSDLGIELDVADLDEIDTLGGLAYTIAGRIPQRGEILHCPSRDGRVLELLIRDADPRRIKTLEVKLLPHAQPAQ